MNFLQVILYPIEELLEVLLSFSYSLTNSYGLAIVVLSIFVNIILLPVYLLAERQQAKEIKIKQKMRDKLDEINECFQGQEKFMMTQTLYRIHNYHPIMGLRAMGSLLIQIPFFFAAYEYLKHFEDFNNVSWLFIQNLHEPDHSIPFGRIAINILPIIMTLVNIYSAKIYTLRKNPQALMSTLLMALVFLVLLYNSPASLVLYWTMNNIFSLGKNFVLRIKDSQLLTETKQTSSFEIFKDYIIKIVSNNIKTLKYVLFLWLASAYFLLSFVLTPTNKTRGDVPHFLLHITTLLLIISAIILLAYYLHHFYDTKKRYAHVLLALTIALWLIGIIALIRFVLIPEYLVDIHRIKIKLFGIWFLMAPNLLFIPTFIQIVQCTYHSQRHKLFQKHSSKINYAIVILASTSLVILTWLTLPISMYISAPREIGLGLIDIITYNILPTVIGILILISLFFLLPHKLKFIYLYILTSISLLTLAYAFIIPFDMGRIDHFKLILPFKLKPSMGLYILEGIGLTLFFFKLHTWLKSNGVFLIIVLALFHIGVFMPFFKLGGNPDTNNFDTQASYSDDGLPSGSKELFGFSPDKPNIVLLLLDMANGGYMQKSLEEHPELSELYDGFTWYPNSLSVSTYTTSSKPSMLSGWSFSPESIKNIEGENLAQKVIRSYDYMFEVFQSFQYKIGITGVTYYGGDNIQCRNLEEQGISCLEYWDSSYIGYWQSKHLDQNNSNIEFSPKKRVQLLNRVALLRSIPISARAFLYDEGNWHLLVSTFKNQEGYNASIKEWAVIDTLDSTSSIIPEEEGDSYSGVFKYVHSNVTHRPYALNKQCVLKNDEFPDPEANNDYEGEAAYYAVKCSLLSLSRWLKWLKENNIYDNTKIIIVSDHGNDFADDPSNVNHIEPFMMGRADEEIFSRAHILLLVKDFDAQGTLEIDNRFMSNADVASIFFHAIDGYKPAENSHPRDKVDPTKHRFEDEGEVVLPIYHTAFYNWIDLVKEKTTFEITNEYQVKSNIFLPENWERMK